MTSNYDMAQLRKDLIAVLAKSLKKSSKFYKDDYNVIVHNVGKKTRKDLLESLSRQNAVNSVSEKTIRIHSQC